jgi:hypothetical protein
MNTNSKSGAGPPNPPPLKKKSGRPRNDLDLSVISVRPPIPPAPVLAEIHRTDSDSINRIITPSIRSPIDQTPIMINGRVVNLEYEIDERIGKSSPVIKPSTPPPQPYQLPPSSYTEEQKTPPSLPRQDEVVITESPPETPRQNSIEEAEDEVEEETKIVKQDIIQPQIRVKSHDPIVIKIETLPNKPLNFTSVLTEESSTTTTSSYQSSPTSSEDSNLQNLNKKDPFDFAKSLNLVGSAESDSEDEGPNIQFPSSSSIPVPVIHGRMRVDSPIETIGGPSSPPHRPKDETKPMFTDHGKSFTPRRNAPVVNNVKTPPKVIGRINDDKAPSVRHVIHPSPKASPPKQASPIRPGTSPSPRARTPPRSFTPRQEPHQIQGPSMFFPPKSEQGSSMFGGRPDYSKLTPDQLEYMRSEFRVKFGILRSSYPQWNVIDLSPTLTLDQIHDLYEYYIRQIIVSKETGQYKVYLLIFFMFVEVVGVKLLKLNMSGYTMSQLKIMNRYDSLLTELGEKWLVSSGSDWPVEARLLMMAVFNAVIFIAVRYLCSWMGVEGLGDTIQGFIDNMLNGPGNNQLPSMPGEPTRPQMQTSMPERVESSSGNPLDGLAGAFSGLFGGNKSGGADLGGGITEGIAKLGTMFTSKIQQANQAAKSNPPARPTNNNNNNKSGGRQKLDKRTLFG